MRGRASIATVAFGVLVFYLGPDGTRTSKAAGPTAGSDQFKLAALPLHFERHEECFVTRGPGYAAAIRRESVRLGLRGGNPDASGPGSGTPSQSSVGFRLAGATAAGGIEGESELSARVNYFVGSDPSQWRTNVPTYGKVRCREIYPGIDVIYYGNQHQLEYDFVVAPGADPGRIELEFQGAELQLERNGDLLVRCPTGVVRQRKPVVFQETGEGRREIDGRFELAGDRVRLALGKYDPSVPLIIDPVLDYSSYFGSSAIDGATAIAVDASGHAVVVGYTGSLADFPFQNAYQDHTNSNVALGNAFVMRLAPGGTLVYATYLGGEEHDEARAVAVDYANPGNVYVTGTTRSQGFPITQGAYRTTFRSFSTVFVSKLSAAGGLVYSTFLFTDLSGGSYEGNGIAVEGGGLAFVTGRYNGPHPSSGSVGVGLFVAKINFTGSALVYTNIIFNAVGYAIDVDFAGAAHVAGDTVSGFSSQFFQTTTNAYEANSSSYQLSRAFYMKLDEWGTNVLYCTLLGSRNQSTARGIDVDILRRAHLTGSIRAPGNPNSLQTGDFRPKNALQSRFGGGLTDAYIARFDASLAGSNSLLYATYLGGTNDDAGAAIAVDALSRMFLTGWTASTNFPLAEPIQTNNAGGKDIFVAQLNAAGSGLIFSSYFGGTAEEIPGGIALDLAAENLYFTGLTRSPDLPTLNAVQPNLTGGDGDAFAAKVRLVLPQQTFTVNSTNDIDDGSCDVPHCSLREAINAANSAAGRQEITFDIEATGVPVILPNSALPAITQEVVIDGTTQPDAGKVQIDGNVAGTGVSGLHITGGNTEIRGMVINRFSGDGIRIENGGGNVLIGNLVGTDSTGNEDRGNGQAGIHILNSASNTVGQLNNAATRNVIAGNSVQGILIAGSGSAANRIFGNHIGVNFDATQPLGNSGSGITIDDAAGNFIGGPGQQRNQISANSSGVIIQGPGASNNVVQNNVLGSPFAARPEFGNQTGLVISHAPKNTIGGPRSASGSSAGLGNLIAGNQLRGIWLTGSGASSNRLQGNEIGLGGATGSAALGNGIGIVIEDAPSNTVGGVELVLGNSIFGGDGDGIQIKGAAAAGNRVLGNQIGGQFPNGGHGVAVDGAPRTEVGGEFEPGLFGLPQPKGGNWITSNSLNGVWISGRSASSNIVQGNTIARNGRNGVLIEDAMGCAVGGATSNHFNIIVQNNANGVAITMHANDNVVRGNFIGFDPFLQGAHPNQLHGVFIDRCRNNTVGGPTAKAGDHPGNMISGNRLDGIHITGFDATDNKVQGNLIGLNYLGRSPLPNGDGVVVVDAPGNLIGGTESNARNVISGNTFSGVSVRGQEASDNFIQGNYIGTTLDGSSPAPNTMGVAIVNSLANLVGGPVNAPGEPPGNVISGNQEDGILIFMGQENEVQGNLVGPAANGGLLEHALGGTGNLDFGVRLQQSESNLIGGTEASHRNLISGNHGRGVMLEDGSNDNRVFGNFIGTDLSGTQAVPNGSVGVEVAAGHSLARPSSRNLVGDIAAVPGAPPGNVISGNESGGVAIKKGEENWIRGNIIGANAPGLAALPNRHHGIFVTDESFGNIIGGSELGSRNLVSANEGSGIVIQGRSSNTRIQGNLIGTEITGTANLGNRLNGITLGPFGSATKTLIGGLGLGEANTVAFNRVQGIAVPPADDMVPSLQNTFAGNAMHSNGDLGIDLASDGVTANDVTDTDFGPNELQNFPVLSQAGLIDGGTLVFGVLRSRSAAAFHLEFFRNSTCDPLSGHGEGEIFVARKQIKTAANGVAPFGLVLPQMAAGSVITATATDPDGNTSEFSPCVTVRARAENDGDGVEDVIEDAAPNNGDGNNDGMPDRQQSHVASAFSSTGAGYITAEATGGYRIKYFVTPLELAEALAIRIALLKLQFSLGFFRLQLEALPPPPAARLLGTAGSVPVTLHLPPDSNVNRCYLYGPTPDNATPHWYEFAFDGTTGAVFAPNKVTLHFVDGARGDHDLAVNGTITTAGGLAFAASDIPLRITDLSPLALGQLLLKASGEASRPYTVQRSSNLTDWAGAWTTNSTTGVFEYIDRPPTSETGTFYRLFQPQP